LFGKPTLDLVTTAPAFCFWLLSPDRSAPLLVLPRCPETGPDDRVYVKRRSSPRAALTPCACPNPPKAVQFPPHPVRRLLPEGIVMFQMTEKRLCRCVNLLRAETHRRTDDPRPHITRRVEASRSDHDLPTVLQVSKLSPWPVHAVAGNQVGLNQTTYSRSWRYTRDQEHATSVMVSYGAHDRRTTTNNNPRRTAARETTGRSG
jgi:hypothetical protein